MFTILNFSHNTGHFTCANAVFVSTTGLNSVRTFSVCDCPLRLHYNFFCQRFLEPMNKQCLMFAFFGTQYFASYFIFFHQRISTICTRICNFCSRPFIGAAVDPYCVELHSCCHDTAVVAARKLKDDDGELVS